MPNWCENRLTISGPEADVDALVARVAVPVPDPGEYGPYRALDYAALLPVPEGLADPDPEVLSEAEYDWRCRHWGCKWNHPGLDVEERLGAGDAVQLEWGFDSPWSPPLGFVQALAEAFPTLHLHLRYEEEANALRGRWDPGEPAYGRDDLRGVAS
jgi:hypothetical protein